MLHYKVQQTQASEQMMVHNIQVSDQARVYIYVHHGDHTSTGSPSSLSSLTTYFIPTSCFLSTTYEVLVAQVSCRHWLNQHWAWSDQSWWWGDQSSSIHHLLLKSSNRPCSTLRGACPLLSLYPPICLLQFHKIFDGTIGVLGFLTGR